MRLARLSAVVLLLCCAPVFAQSEKDTDAATSIVRATPTRTSEPATAKEPWRIIPSRPTQEDVLQEFGDRVRQYKADYYQMDVCANVISPYQFWPGGHLSKEALEDRSCYKRNNTKIDSNVPPTHDPNAEVAAVVFPSDEGFRQGAGDTTCYKIRSYVVARDSKDTDSVHPVGYTTCVPTNKIQRKSTVLHTTDR